MSTPAEPTRLPTTPVSRFSARSGVAVKSVISVVVVSGREFPRSNLEASEHALGLELAKSVGAVTSAVTKEPNIMARSPSINRPRTRKPHLHYEEQRPVLQLPLERPEWREPVERGKQEPETDRGIAVIDFYI